MSENAEASMAKKILKEAWEWTYTIVIAVVIAMIIKTFLFDVVKVDGSSMYPTLENNDRLIVTKLGYTPEQGDIIILDSTYKKRTAYYEDLAEEKGKEKIGKLSQSFGYFSLDPELKHRYYVKRVIALPGQTIDLKDGKVYVDGAELSEPYYDGETFPTDSMVEFPLTVADDMVFVMGDNRDHSLDSRRSELGQVPYEAIMGKAQLRIFPFDKIGSTK